MHEHECGDRVGGVLVPFHMFATELTASSSSESESAAMINLSDDSENEEDEFMPMPKSSKGTSPGPWAAAAMPPAGTAPRRQTVSSGF